MRAVVLYLGLSAAALSQTTFQSSELLRYSNSESAAYNGVGRLRGPATCTGFLVRTADPARTPNAPAYVFTNGHCLAFLGANEVVLDRTISGTFTMNYFIDAPADRQHAVPLRRVAWATMKGIDMAIFELQTTLGDLAGTRGFRPLQLSSASAAAAGDALIHVGAPVNGIPPGEAFLRRSRCRLGPAVDLLEFRWHMLGFLRNDCPDVLGGASGSPLLAAATGEVVGIINTGTTGEFDRGAGWDCYLNHPCEYPDRGNALPEVRDDASYASPLPAGVVNCFGAADGVFNVQLPGCPLDRGAQPAVTNTARVVRSGAGAAWSVTVPTTVATYRYKLAAGPRDCAASTGYSGARPRADFPRITDPMTAGAAGFAFLCVLAGTGSGTEFASILFAGMDNQPPAVPLQYSLRELESGWSVEPFFGPPEISNINYKLGADVPNLCADPTGYRFYPRIPIRVDRAAGEQRLCLVAEDEAGNAAPPVEIRLARGEILPGGVVNGASFQRGPVAPGSWVAIFGVDLAGVESAALVTSTGQSYAFPVSYSSAGQVNLRLPEDAAAPGAAELRLLPEGRGTEIRLERVSPGILAPPAPLDLTPGRANVLELYGTGWRWASASEVTARIGVQPVEVESISRAPGLPGIDLLRLRLPADFGLRGYQPVILEVDGKRANITRLWLR